jgi:hypothetical protein
MTDRLGSIFERLVRAELANRPGVPHEWRRVHDGAGERRDVVCYPGSATEVWASIRSDSVAVGSGAGHRDYEDLGHRASTDQIAIDAVRRFGELLAARRSDPAV